MTVKVSLLSVYLHVVVYLLSPALFHFSLLEEKVRHICFSPKRHMVLGYWLSSHKIKGIIFIHVCVVRYPCALSGVIDIEESVAWCLLETAYPAVQYFLGGSLSLRFSTRGVGGGTTMHVQYMLLPCRSLDICICLADWHSFARFPDPLLLL